MASQSGEWAGIPTPLANQRLIIDRSYKFADALMKTGAAESNEPQTCTRRLRNSFWSWKWRMQILVWDDDADGKIHWGIDQGGNSYAGMELQTLGCADAWTLESEDRALHSLKGLVSFRQFRSYLLTGMFIETSKRSGLKYIFRRLKPTVVLHEVAEEIKIMICLCLHPVGYYHGSWAGAMVPTDDVIGHLMLMRGDEALYWRRANHIRPEQRESGI